MGGCARVACLLFLFLLQIQKHFLKQILRFHVLEQTQPQLFRYSDSSTT